MSFSGQEVLGDAVYILHTRGRHLYAQLRPEFVLTCPLPLSSDAYSGFGMHDRAIHNAEVRDQTDRLLQQVKTLNKTPLNSKASFMALSWQDHCFYNYEYSAYLLKNETLKKNPSLIWSYLR